MSKLQLVYYISSMQICFLFTKQILQSELRVKDKSGFTFCDKSGDAILLATPNLWNNIQIAKTYIFKYNIYNPVSLATRYPNFETLHCYFGHISDEVMYHILDNIKDVKKIHFLIQKYVCYSCTLRKIYQHSFPKNYICSSKPLGLIYSDFLELSTLFYSKYKQVITFFDDYSSYCNIVFLYKNSEVIEAIKSIF